MPQLGCVAAWIPKVAVHSKAGRAMAERATHRSCNRASSRSKSVLAIGPAPSSRSCAEVPGRAGGFPLNFLLGQPLLTPKPHHHPIYEEQKNGDVHTRARPALQASVVFHVLAESGLPSHGCLILLLGLQEELVGLAVLFFRGVRRLRDRTPGGDGIGGRGIPTSGLGPASRHARRAHSASSTTGRPN